MTSINNQIVFKEELTLIYTYWDLTKKESSLFLSTYHSENNKTADNDITTKLYSISVVREYFNKISIAC